MYYNLLDMVQNTKAYKWVRGQADRALQIDFIRFGIVGSVGFVVTAIALHTFKNILGLNVLPATLLASECGLLSNFVFHQNWTYKHVDHSHKSLWKKFVHFQTSSWSGVVIFTAIETIAVTKFKINDMIALVIASGITMFWNFFWTKYFIFKGKTPAVLGHVEDIAKDEV